VDDLERPSERLYTPLDVASLDYTTRPGVPGEYPFTRGVHPTMHRGRLWTMRMFAGLAWQKRPTPATNTCWSTARPACRWRSTCPRCTRYDSDAPEALGEFGKCGWPVSSLADMEVLFDGIPVDQITTSMTINSPAAIVWAMLHRHGRKAGHPDGGAGGTIQNDILKEYIAQKEFIFPPKPSMRLVVDTFEFGSQHLPQWNTISISGYHIREAGATAVQELAFTWPTAWNMCAGGWPVGWRSMPFARAVLLL